MWCLPKKKTMLYQSKQECTKAKLAKRHVAEFVPSPYIQQASNKGYKFEIMESQNFLPQICLVLRWQKDANTFNPLV